MTKYLRILLLFFSLITLTAPMVVDAKRYAAEADAILVQSDPVITISGTNIRVQNGQGLMLEVYNITGLRVYSLKIEKPDTTATLKLPKGCYIIKVGKTVRKFSIV